MFAADLNADISLFIPTSDRIEGILFDANDDGKFIIRNMDELDYEFQDSTFKSTIKRIRTTKQKEVILSINRFTDEMVNEFSQNNISVRDQYLLL